MTTRIDAQALLLDMDGTLVDSTAAVERVWGAWASENDLDPSEVFEVIHGRQGHESMAILLPHRSREQNLADNQRLQERETADTDGIVAIPGAADLLTALADLPHALVTSAPTELASSRMEAAGLSVPAVAVTAESVSASKPDPEGFLAAAATLGVRPEACVVLEDSAAGVSAGLAAGMRVLGVGAASAGHGATWTVTDLAGVGVVGHERGVTITLPA